MFDPKNCNFLVKGLSKNNKYLEIKEGWNSVSCWFKSRFSPRRTLSSRSLEPLDGFTFSWSEVSISYSGSPGNPRYSGFNSGFSKSWFTLCKGLSFGCNLSFPSLDCFDWEKARRERKLKMPRTERSEHCIALLHT